MMGDKAWMMPWEREAGEAQVTFARNGTLHPSLCVVAHENGPPGP